MQTVSELAQENAQIRAQLLSQEALLESKDHLIEQLTQALILARHRQFAKTTESLRSLQSELFDEAELSEMETATASADGETDSIGVPAHRRKKSGRSRYPPIYRAWTSYTT